jgi:CRISPR/Cas system endoribonuclease Cas6 (RAMP superfamily)
LRIRATELKQGTLMPLLDELGKKGAATFASTGDREVRAASYEDLLGDADPFRRVAALQFASPMIAQVSEAYVPFPVTSATFDRYREAWDAFSEDALPPAAAEVMRYVRVADFRISPAATPFGTGAEGWITLEMETGRTEKEIALFNALVDFAFYCGTGVHTTEGLGQTRRMETKQGGGPKERRFRATPP